MNQLKKKHFWNKQVHLDTNGVLGNSEKLLIWLDVIIGLYFYEQPVNKTIAKMWKYVRKKYVSGICFKMRQRSVIQYEMKLCGRRSLRGYDSQLPYKLDYGNWRLLTPFLILGIYVLSIVPTMEAVSWVQPSESIMYCWDHRLYLSELPFSPL